MSSLMSEQHRHQPGRLRYPAFNWVWLAITTILLIVWWSSEEQWKINFHCSPRSSLISRISLLILHTHTESGASIIRDSTPPSSSSSHVSLWLRIRTAMRHRAILFYRWSSPPKRIRRHTHGQYRSQGIIARQSWINSCAPRFPHIHYWYDNSGHVLQGTKAYICPVGNDCRKEILLLLLRSLLHIRTNTHKCLK